MIRAFLLVLLLALPLGARAQDTTSQPSGSIAVQDSAQQDAAIAVRIRDILGELEGYGNVTVTVSSGIVTLRGTTIDAATAARLNELVARVEGVVAIENEVTETTDVVERLNPLVERLQNRATQAVAFLPLAGIALSTFALIVVLGFWIARARWPWDRLAPNAFIADIYRQIVRLAAILGGIVVALDIMGATALLGTILGAAGIVGLAIGFAVRDTVENFIASIMLSIRQPFRPNDTIEIDGDMGKVIRLTSRATILLSFDGNHIRIPNSTVFKSRIVNWTVNPEARFKFEIGVASDADLYAVRQLTEETVAGLPFTIENPAPMTWIDRIGDGAIFLTVTGWIDQRETSLVRARGEALRQVKAAIEARGIEVPDTTYRVDLLSGAGPLAVQLSAGTDTPEPSEPMPVPVLPPSAGAVDEVAKFDTSLDELVDAERADPDAPDLLTETAPHE
ncbi:MAG: mechanosensitive ion channel family protein [Pseudomonadota bacterium]